MQTPKLHSIDFDPALLDSDAVKVIQRLLRHGYEAYLVGGCVRDLILGEHPKDFDVVTNARPEEIKKLFRNCRIIGRRFRLAHIYFAHQKIIEVATFRATAPESSPDGHFIQDDNVFGTAQTDALRRDFTLNALFFDVKENQIIDYVQGMQHLRKRLLVCIGSPWVRFREDPVRMIRAAKFSARLGLEMEDDVWKAMLDCHEEMASASPSRMAEEVFKILSGKGGVAQCFQNLHRVQSLKYVLPFLHEGQDPGADGFWDYLKALDWARTLKIPEPWAGGLAEEVPAPPKGFDSPSRALLLGILIAPLLRDLWQAFRQGVGNHRVRVELQNKVQEYGTALRNPRKDTFRARQFLLAQERLFQGATPERESSSHRSKRKRRRFVSPASFSQRAHFQEALQWFWIYAVVVQDPELWLRFRSWLPFEHAPVQEIPSRKEGSSRRGRRKRNAPGRTSPGSRSGRNKSKRNRRRRRRSKGSKNSAPSVDNSPKSTGEKEPPK